METGGYRGRRHVYRSGDRIAGDVCLVEYLSWHRQPNGSRRDVCVERFHNSL